MTSFETTTRRRMSRSATALLLVLCSSQTSSWANAFAPHKTSAAHLGRIGTRCRARCGLAAKSSETTEGPPPPKSSEARLTVVQITDVYNLDNFASLKTMLKEKRSETTPGSKVISVLTGDFLAPYLLSTVDKGAGMMNAIAKTPIDYLTWGNHEADIDHETVCKHVRDYKSNGGTFINTNMQSHEAMDSQVPFEVIEVSSEDGSNVRRVGLVAVLSDDPALYKHFEAEGGAFGGAKILDPWETLREYKEMLESPPYNCDVVLPLQHLYVPDDHKTCREFDFPVIMSGHDHHQVDEVVDGTRLLKPGQDADFATVLDLSWEDASSESNVPKVDARFVRCADYEPEPELQRECQSAYDVLLPMRNSELVQVPPAFQPLSSVDARGKVTTMGKFVCSSLKHAINSRGGGEQSSRQRRVDAVLLMGGNIRGGTDYEKGSFFSLEALQAEVKPEEVVDVVEMPGWLLSQGLGWTHAGDPIPGWIQHDDGVRLAAHPSGGAPIVTHVDGKPIQPGRIYRVATKIPDLTNGQSAPWTAYYKDNSELLPSNDANVMNIHEELMGIFARYVGRRVCETLNPVDRIFSMLSPNSQLITVIDIHSAMRKLGMSVDPSEQTLATLIYELADAKGTGRVTLQDFQAAFLPKAAVPAKKTVSTDSFKWRLAFPVEKSNVVSSF